MKSSRAWIVWLSLAVCAVTVFGAMTWLTRNVLSAAKEQAATEQEREAAEARADLEERTRLALWRLDALGAATVLRENSQPPAHYELLTGSPFLKSSDPEVLLHFQIQQGGGLISPELDELNAMESGVSKSVIQERKTRMARLQSLLAANPLPGDEWSQLSCAAVVGETSWNAVPKDAVLEKVSNKLLRQNQLPGYNRRDATYQKVSNTNEYAQRAKAVAMNFDNAQQGGDLQIAQVKRQSDRPSLEKKATPADPASAATDMRRSSFGEVEEINPMRGVWIADELFLLRRVIRNSPGRQHPPKLLKSVQGAWLNSKALKSLLLVEIQDLLPHSALVAATGKDIANNPLTMASLPFQLERNEVIAVGTAPARPTLGAPLWIGWAAVTLAVLATSLLVRGIMRLSDRRASFVSAVTHELRTPLTTFRLYSDMLESGAVKEEKRGHYLQVLSREADRLSHLVENVLAFSRIERGNARANVREIAAGEMLESFRERLEARLATAGMMLEINTESPARVRVDTAAVEHILFNLIDNAAKYASAGEPPTVEITVRDARGAVNIIVSDHGPGIPAAERGRVFHAFHKSARDAAEGQPGVGLGLALSRRLAKGLGGSLECEDSGSGAVFVLRLPGAPQR